MPMIVQEGPSLTQKTSELNMAVQNKWIATIPLQMIFKDLPKKRICLNLTSFNLPEFSVGTADVSFQGVTMQVPNFIRSQSKEISFEYLISSDYYQYRLLHKWLGTIVQQIGAGSNSTTGMAGYVLPVRVYLLSEFKNPVLEVVYNNCWIKSFGPLNLDSQNPSAPVIKHMFTLAYTDFSINDDIR